MTSQLNRVRWGAVAAGLQTSTLKCTLGVDRGLSPSAGWTRWCTGCLCRCALGVASALGGWIARHAHRQTLVGVPSMWKPPYERQAETGSNRAGLHIGRRYLTAIPRLLAVRGQRR